MPPEFHINKFSVTQAALHQILSSHFDFGLVWFILRTKLLKGHKLIFKVYLLSTLTAFDGTHDVFYIFVVCLMTLSVVQII
jgi:hypothetical protein